MFLGFRADKSYLTDIFHAYIKYNYVDNPKRLDLFAIRVVKWNWNYDEIVVDICKAWKIYKLGWDAHPIYFKRPNMTIQAHIWITFLLHNVTLVSHISSTTLIT